MCVIYEIGWTFIYYVYNMMEINDYNAYNICKGKSTILFTFEMKQ